MFTGTFTDTSTGTSTETSTGLLPHLYRDFYRNLHRHSTGISTDFVRRERCYTASKCETLVRDATQIRVTVHDVEKVSGETMTETMTNGGKNEKRDTTHRRIALRVAPPGLEPGLS